MFAVSDLAAAAVAAAGAAVAQLVAARFGALPRVTMSRRLSSLWFGRSIRPDGWKLPRPWDRIAGDYPTADGWIRLHTNAPHHRDAALSVLGVSADKSEVARAVVNWSADALETAVIQNNGCAAAMRSMAAWATHAQGESVSREPLVATQATGDCWDSTLSSTQERPLRGIRVLDLTRVLAGPVATRFLGGFGADVLRIDPPVWDDPAVVPDVTLGKRCARLDLRSASERSVFLDLLRRADVLVHGYRSDALDNLGLDALTLRAIRPGLVDVSLNAYGWSGPWRNRRGFDSLVQMSSGIADAGMRILGQDRPTPLPVQALDHTTGYLMAAAVVRGLSQRVATAQGFAALTPWRVPRNCYSAAQLAEPAEIFGPPPRRIGPNLLKQRTSGPPGGFGPRLQSGTRRCSGTDPQRRWAAPRQRGSRQCNACVLNLGCECLIRSFGRSPKIPIARQHDRRMCRSVGSLFNRRFLAHLS